MAPIDTGPSRAISRIDVSAYPRVEKSSTAKSMSADRVASDRSRPRRLVGASGWVADIITPVLRVISTLRLVRTPARCRAPQFRGMSFHGRSRGPLSSRGSDRPGSAGAEKVSPSAGEQVELAEDSSVLRAGERAGLLGLDAHVGAALQLVQDRACRRSATGQVDGRDDAVSVELVDLVELFEDRLACDAVDAARFHLRIHGVTERESPRPCVHPVAGNLVGADVLDDVGKHGVRLLVRLAVE